MRTIALLQILQDDLAINIPRSGRGSAVIRFINLSLSIGRPRWRLSFDSARSTRRGTFRIGAAGIVLASYRGALMLRSWKTPRRLLCATDLAPNSDRALDRAAQLAAEWHASLLLVNIVDDTGLLIRDFASDTRAAEVLLTRRVADHPGAAKVNAEVIVSQGHPAERILAKCDRLFIDLLVMGTGEKASLTRRLFGSTVDHVLRHALQPVLSVRDRPQAAYRTMAIATDFSLPSREALDCALAFFPDAKATVVHAYEETLHGLLDSDQVTGELADRHKIEMRAVAEKAMSDFVEEPRRLRSDLATALEIGPPELAIKSYIERHNPDLVVVGTHGRTGFRRAVIGSVAERLIATLPRDVMAVRPTE